MKIFPIFIILLALLSAGCSNAKNQENIILSNTYKEASYNVVSTTGLENWVIIVGLFNQGNEAVVNLECTYKGTNSIKNVSLSTGYGEVHVPELSLKSPIKIDDIKISSAVEKIEIKLSWEESNKHKEGTQSLDINWS